MYVQWGSVNPLHKNAPSVGERSNFACKRFVPTGVDGDRMLHNIGMEESLAGQYSKPKRRSLAPVVKGFAGHVLFREEDDGVCGHELADPLRM